LTLHVWSRKTKQKPFGTLATTARVDEQMGRELENLTMPGGRRVTGKEGQKAEFREEVKGKKVNPAGKGEMLLKVSFLIFALTLFNGFYL
jgi:hypothetical protein